MNKPAFKVFIIYFLISFLWIVLSDKILFYYVQDSRFITNYQTFKGLLFVFTTSVIIYFLVRTEIKKKNQNIYLIKESEKLINNLLSNLSELNIYLIDSDFKHILAHGNGLFEFNYNPENIRDKKLIEISLEPEFRQLITNGYKKVLKGKNISFEFNSNDKWYEYRGTPLKNEDGVIYAIAALYINITEKKQFTDDLFRQKSEIESLYEEYLSINEELNDKVNKLSILNKQLEKSESKYRMFFENINDAAYIHEVEKGNTPGPFIEVNQKLAEQLGYTREELLMKHPYEIATPESVEKFKSSGYWDQDRQHQYIEVEHLSKNGKSIPVEVSLHFFENEGKKMVFGTVRDIRERVKYIRKLNKAKEKAEESDRLKSSFLSNISHEIRTPLNGIIGFSELIAQYELTKEQKTNYSNLIKHSADQLLNIVNDIIDISKIETHQLILIQKDISINVLMDDLYKQTFNLLKRNEKDISLKCEKPLMANDDVIIADSARLVQVLKNLLDNAEKFTKSGTINFGYRLKDESKIEFFVNDTGIGLAPEKHHIVFERFRQADDSHTREFGGTGLGLPIAKGIVELMHGSISLKSEVNKGTEVSFTIPVTFSNKKQKIIINYNDLDEPDLSKKVILIVEDNPESSDLIAEYASMSGASILRAYKGKDAIEICEKNKNIDIAFMDIRLPDISGLEVTQQIKKILPDIYIIAQTAYNSSEDRQNCLDAGCDDYVSKPINKSSFNKKVFQYLLK